jgi:hypothetical protein
MGPHGFAAAFFAIVIAVWLGALAVIGAATRLPDSADGTMVAVFAPWKPTDQALAAVVAADGYPLRPMADGAAWVVYGEGAGFVGRLRRAGAWAAFAEIPLDLGPALVGCVGMVIRPRS